MTRDDIPSFDAMVDVLAAEGVDLNFEDKRVWIEPPEKLFRKLVAGEVSFGRHPDPALGHEFSLWSTRSRIRLHTPTEQFIEVWREYRGERVSQVAKDGDPVWRHLAYPGWTISETSEPGESPEETAVKGVRQEFGGLEILPSVLVPLRRPYARQSGLLKNYALMNEDEPLHDTHPSTVFPCWSTVESHWFLWPVAEANDRLREGVYLHDDDVLIYREWQPL